MSFPLIFLYHRVTLFSFQGTSEILIYFSPTLFMWSGIGFYRVDILSKPVWRLNHRCVRLTLANWLLRFTSRKLLSFVRHVAFCFAKSWWRWGESNSWPPACKAGALPAELHPQISFDTSFFWSLYQLGTCSALRAGFLLPDSFCSSPLTARTYVLSKVAL